MLRSRNVGRRKRWKLRSWDQPWRRKSQPKSPSQKSGGKGSGEGGESGSSDEEASLSEDEDPAGSTGSVAGRRSSPPFRRTDAAGLGIPLSGTPHHRSLLLVVNQCLGHRLAYGVGAFGSLRPRLAVLGNDALTRHMVFPANLSCQSMGASHRNLVTRAPDTPRHLRRQKGEPDR